MTPTSPAELRELRAEISAHLSRYGTPDAATLEERCRSYLEPQRWPGGVRCPRCEEGRRLLWLESRSRWHCYGCRYQFSVTAATLFHRSHLPLWKWFIAVHLMVEAPREVSALELRTTIGGSYKTAWFAAHRIRAAMRRNGAELLRSLIQAERARQAAATSSEGPLPALQPGLTPTERHALLARVRRLFPAHTHHHSSTKYLPGYIDETRWRHSNRDNPHAVRDTLLALLHGEGLSYQELTATRPTS